MREVTRHEFKEAYFRLGGGESSGWTADYWARFFETDQSHAFRYRLEDPPSPRHTRMMIVTDFEAGEYRMFFLTEESEESLFTFPGEE